jgi:hypothetical protein
MKKFFIILGLVVLGLLVLPLFIALFVKKEYSVEREISIAKPKQVVFDYVKYLKNQDNFSVWAKIDPGMKKEYRGTDGTVGFVSGWDSYLKMAGKGEQEIMKIADGERIDYEIRFSKPMKATNTAFMAFKPVDDNNTNVKWCFSGKVRYPMNFMFLFVKMDVIIGNDLARGLKNLKAELEK